VIRPVSPADEAVLSDFFAALSVESRYLRFFAPVTPSCGLLDLMAGRPAHVDAIIAVADGVIVGHAMAADRPAPGEPGNRGVPGGPRATDVGVVVADAWQRRGVGAALMRALIRRAQARGVTALAMDVLPGNRRVLAMIAGHWPEAVIGRSADGVDIRIPLPPHQPRPPYAARPEARPPAITAGRPLAAAVGKPLAVAGR
jgi:GNAT superfamily N-acetyltransferase